MKKNISINLFGTLYNIDEDAYELLDRYMESVKRYFNREGGEDISDDIEHRIAELLWERREAGLEAIDVQTVRDIISKIGDPSDIDDGSVNHDSHVHEEDPNSSSSFTENRQQGYQRQESSSHYGEQKFSAWMDEQGSRLRGHFRGRRLYRDPDDKVLGGICSGFAQYVGGSDPLPWRLLLVFLFFCTRLSVGIIYLILWPIASYSSLIADGMPLIAAGSQELRDLAHEYNALYEENRQRADHLRHKADHDPLTGLFNRGAYDDFAATYTEHVALMLVDVDYFKTVNDTYGHEVGDQILKKVARHLDHAFRASDFPCRIGGDEFAVVITDMSPQLKHVVTRKIGQIAQGMLDTSDGLPAITLSIGVAFSEQLAADDTIFKAADRALYLVKERGRNGYAFSDEVG